MMKVIFCNIKFQLKYLSGKQFQILARVTIRNIKLIVSFK